MKISEVIKNLETFKKNFGDVDLKFPEYVETETTDTYSRKLILHDCNISVGDFGTHEFVAVAHKTID